MTQERLKKIYSIIFNPDNYNIWYYSVFKPKKAKAMKKRIKRAKKELKRYYNTK